MSREDDRSALETLSALDELMADRATVGLDDEQDAELAALLRAEGVGRGGEAAADESWERAAAAIDLALLADQEPALPDLLARRLQDDAAEFFAGGPPQTKSSPSTSPGSNSGLAWTVAALCAAAALVLLFTRPRGPAVVDGGDSGGPVAEGPETTKDPSGPSATSGTEPTSDPVEPAPVEPSPAASRTALLDREDTVRLPWTATEDPFARGATGDVVWNDAEQRGFMLIRGLAANDIEALQYQLWIFDPARDERYPVDGGVFDIPAGAEEVVIPIDAKLAVAGPNLFAITVEQPGGVVVSSRERIVLLAQAGS